jgi:hypothetical protein
MRPWRGFIGPLKALAEATDDPNTNDPGADVCLLLGATIAQAANLCVAGDAGACSVLLSDWVLYQQLCFVPPST